MIFDYFYEKQSEDFTFYRIPQVIFTDERFRELSSDAKVLYGILLDRVSLSRMNAWFDDDGKVYVYMTVKAVEELLDCAHQKACKVLADLEKFGLIERVKQRLCRPDRIYVKNFMQVWNSYLQRYECNTRRDMESTHTEVAKSYTNNTYINNTNISNTNPILSGGDVDKDERELSREYLYKQLDMSVLYKNYPYDKENLDAIFSLIMDVVCSKRKRIRIAGDDKPVDVVKSQFLKLNHMHIEYVMDCVKTNGSRVRNIKQYLLASLYNAPLTMNSYYQTMVNNDMAEGKI